MHFFILILLMLYIIFFRIAKARDTGILDFLYHKWFDTSAACDHDNEKNVVPVTLEMIQVAFLLAGMGVCISVTVLILEYIIKKNSNVQT